mgnify:CR=1 FL=1
MVRWLTLLVAIICMTPVAASAGAVADTLTFPAILVNRSKAPRTVEVFLTAAKARLPLMPGKVTEVFAFNGAVPGPTLEAREGGRARLLGRRHPRSGVLLRGPRIPASYRDRRA